MKKKWEVLVHFVVLFSLLLIPFGSISAQEDPFQVFFTPDPAYIYVNEGNTKVVTVDLANAVDIWSFDVIILYDVNVASITAYAITDWFGSIYCAKEENLPGYFRASCASMGVPVNGDGTLFTLTFESVSVGQTALTFSKNVFGNTAAQPVPVVPDNGQLNVVDLTNLLYLPLIANMQVQGKLDDRSGVRLSLAPGSAYGFDYEGTSTDIPGENLLIDDVAVDTYVVTASHEGCLSASGTIAIPQDATSFSLPALVLKAGNAQDADEIIDVYDLAIVNGAYGDFAANPDGDVNFDGQIDARDMALVAGNFGLTSAAAYADWLG